MILDKINLFLSEALRAGQSYTVHFKDGNDKAQSTNVNLGDAKPEEYAKYVEKHYKGAMALSVVDEKGKVLWAWSHKRK